MLCRLLYLSSPHACLTDAGLEDLVRDIRLSSLRNNSAASLTGVLAYSTTMFVQALEGEAPKVEAAFARILADPRHLSPSLLRYGPVPARAYGDWSVAFARVPDDVDLREARSNVVMRFLIEAAQKCEGVRALPGFGLAPEARRRGDLGLS